MKLCTFRLGKGGEVGDQQEKQKKAKQKCSQCYLPTDKITSRSPTRPLKRRHLAELRSMVVTRKQQRQQLCCWDATFSSDWIGFWAFGLDVIHCSGMLVQRYEWIGKVVHANKNKNKSQHQLSKCIHAYTARETVGNKIYLATEF